MLSSYYKYSDSTRELQLICPKTIKKIVDDLQIVKNVLLLHLQTKQNGVVVQLVRIPACHAGGREFESRPYRRKSEGNSSGFFVFKYLSQTLSPDPLRIGACCFNNINRLHLFFFDYIGVVAPILLSLIRIARAGRNVDLR